MIKSIRLTRFKQFKDTEIKLQPFSILMGENNSGKTTVLQGIWLALTGLHQGRLLSVDWKNGQTKVSSTGHPMYDIPFAPKGDFSGIFYNRISREGQTYDENSGTMLQLKDDRDNCLRLHFRELFRNLNVKLLTPAQDLRGPQLQNYEPLFLSGSSGLRFQEERMFPAMMEAESAKGNADAIVRNIILDLKQQSPEKYRYLEQLLEKEFGFRICEIRFREHDERYVFSEYEESFDENTKEETVRLEFGSTGSGMMQILQILAGILRYCPEKTRVVLIDEPEAHLHGNLQVRFLKLLKKIQEELNLQVILATHSEPMIRAAQPQWVIPISSHSSVNSSLNFSEELEQILKDQLDAYELGRAKVSGKLVFLEGRLQRLLESAADQLGLDCFTGMHTIPFVCGWQKSDDLPFDLGEALTPVLGRKIEIYAIYDSDRTYGPEAALLQELAERSGVHLHGCSSSEIRQMLRVMSQQSAAKQQTYRSFSAQNSLETQQTARHAELFETLQAELQKLLTELQPKPERSETRQAAQECGTPRKDYEQLSFFDL